MRVRVRCFVVTGGHKWVLYGSVAERGGRGSASGLWLKGRLCSMLTVMLWRLEHCNLGVNLDPNTSQVRVRVRVGLRGRIVPLPFRRSTRHTQSQGGERKELSPWNPHE